MRGAFLVRLLRLVAMAAVLTAAGIATPAEPAPRILKAKGLQTATFMQFSPDGRYLAAHYVPITMPAGNAFAATATEATGSGLGTIAVWDVAKGKLLWRQPQTTPDLDFLGSHNSHVISFSPDSSLLAIPTSPMGGTFD